MNAETLARIWQELRSACAQRDHDWRSATLATVGLDGGPQARTVILREADEATGRLAFFTDRRSPKVAELGREPRACLVFWCRRLRWQLRVRVQVSLEFDGDAVEATWLRLRDSAAAGDYLAPAAPGTRLAISDGTDRADRADQGDRADHPRLAEHQLCIARAAIEAIDWLELAAAGHRRAIFAAGRIEAVVP